jgi:hypothetical protein
VFVCEDDEVSGEKFRPLFFLFLFGVLSTFWCDPPEEAEKLEAAASAHHGNNEEQRSCKRKKHARDLQREPELRSQGRCSDDSDGR